MAKRFVYIKDARDDYRRQGIYNILPFFAEIAKRMNITPQNISYLQASEVVRFLKDGVKISEKIISERKRGFVLYLDSQSKLVCLHSTTSITKALKKFKLLKEGEKIEKISGTVASKGMAKGKAVIVKRVRDLKKVEEGDILVAIMTHPDYTITMHKAAAIVTDEGGLTCHAAIVSRELGIPCVVGTKIATRVLKDGDFISVDAVKGIVAKVDL